MGTGGRYIWVEGCREDMLVSMPRGLDRMSTTMQFRGVCVALWSAGVEFEG